MVGICMKIHTTLGRGFKEIVYKDAMEIEIRNKGGIPYEREKPFSIAYEGVILPHRFTADYFIFNSIILEVKSVSQLPVEAFRQTLNYLKVSQVKLGIIVNFGADKLEFKRVVCTYQ